MNRFIDLQGDNGCMYLDLSHLQAILFEEQNKQLTLCVNGKFITASGYNEVHKEIYKAWKEYILHVESEKSKLNEFLDKSLKETNIDYDPRHHYPSCQCKECR